MAEAPTYIDYRAYQLALVISDALSCGQLVDYKAHLSNGQIAQMPREDASGNQFRPPMVSVTPSS